MEHHQHTIAAPVVKAVSALAAVGITRWSDAASAVAFLYTTLLLGEWLWKKAIRPACVRHGLLADSKVAGNE